VPEQYEAIMQMREGAGLFGEGSRQWVLSGRQNPWPRPIQYQAVEQKASGYGLIQQAAADGNAFYVLKPEGDKILRAMNAITMYENGKVYHRENANWLGMLESEELAHPTGKYKDLVDCISCGAIIICQNKITTGGEGESERQFVLNPQVPKPDEPPIRVETTDAGDSVHIAGVGEIFFPDDD
jgi:predicted phage terminase large subunit-like protein